MSSKAITARFYEWINDGWVKISLRPGITLRHYQGGKDDEGAWSRHESWINVANDCVLSSCGSYGRDCDGVVTADADFKCRLEDLQAVRCEDGTRRPEWVKMNARMRDYSAEAMGY
jgi:hypothetical protein